MLKFTRSYIRPIFDVIFQMYFHYKTTKCDDDRTVIDDSHKYDKPMEIILGKKFKLEVWETCLKTMQPNEVSEFLVDKLVSSCCSIHAHFLYSLEIPVVEIRIFVH